MVAIYDLRTDYLINPISIDSERPRFHWKIKSDVHNTEQKSYHITANSEGQCIWDSGIIESQEQLVFYEGKQFHSMQKVTWWVEIETTQGTAKSEGASFETGLLKEEDWKAHWIQPEREIDYDTYKVSPLMRREFYVEKNVISAKIFQSAHGLYEFWINGKCGTEDKFKPGLTSYYQRIQYQVYDITSLIEKGENVWAVQLADGWWRGSTGGGFYNNYGFYLSYIGQIILEYEDHTCEIIKTDHEFRMNESCLKRCDMRDGECYDAREADEAWKMAGYEAENWLPVIEATEHNTLDSLIPQRSVPVREHEHFIGKSVIDASNQLLIDFGQNFAGYVQMQFRNTAPGQIIRLTHGEALKDGVFSQENMELPEGKCIQQIEYICRGGELETYQPDFSIFGFRYMKIEGYDEEMIEGDFIGRAVYSEIEETGYFKCSNQLVNQLVQNTKWSQKSNFLDVATDCPTRERAPWSGDAQVYCRTAAEMMNVYAFFEKWLQDMNLEQFEDGCIGNTFPSADALHNAKEWERMIASGKIVFAPPTKCGPIGEGNFMDGSAGWGDVAVIAPYTMYLFYGDITILKQQYQTAKRWVNFCIQNAENSNPLYEHEIQYHTFVDGKCDADYIYDTHFHWGEWMEPGADENNGVAGFNPVEMAKKGNPLVATAYLYHSCKLLAEMASRLGKTDDVHNFSSYADNVKRVYNKYFICEDGEILKGHQSAYVRVLAFDLVEKEKEACVLNKLLQEIKENNYRINTGFLSTPYILQQLVKHGYSEVAMKMLLQTDYPGWLHSILMGATTITEKWAGYDTFKGSFNHYSYGAVCDFLMGYLAGIKPDVKNPGFHYILIEPVIDGDISFVEAYYDSCYGLISSKWEKTGDKIDFYFEIPANTKAIITLPKAKDKIYVGSGNYHYEETYCCR